MRNEAACRHLLDKIIEFLERHEHPDIQRFRENIVTWRNAYCSVEPSHRHQAEEVYLVLAGSAEFQLDDDAFNPKKAGDVVYVSSMQTHGFRTRELCLVVFYIWQAGD